MPQSQYRKSYPRAQGARKPATPQQLLERAVQIATEKGIRVAFAGPDFWAVPSDSEALKGLYHIVQRSADGKHLTCECLYSQNKPGAICSHRAAVYTYLKGQPKAPPAPKVSMIMVHCAIGEHENCTLDCCTCSCHKGNKNTPQPASTGNSRQPVAVSQPAAATAPSASLKVAAPTAAPQGVLVAATTPQVSLSEDAWSRYQDARRNGDFYA